MVPTIHAQQNRDAIGEAMCDQVSKSTPIGLLLAEFVDDQEIRPMRKAGLDSSHRLLQRRRVQTAPPRICAKRLRYPEYLAIRQNPDIHVAKPRVGAICIGLNNPGSPATPGSAKSREIAQ